MIRNLKILGLALVAVLAMSALVASAAQAASFTWAEGTTTLTGEADATGGEQVFTTDAGKVECNTVTASATVSGTSATEVTTSSITYTDTAKEADHCFGPLFTSPKINMNGCNYRFHAGTLVAGTHESNGSADIVCGTGGPIKIEATGCEITVPAQNGLSTINYKTVGTSPTDVTITPNVTNIEYSQHGSLCKEENNVKNGTYTGNVTVKGKNSKGTQTSVTID